MGAERLLNFHCVENYSFYNHVYYTLFHINISFWMFNLFLSGRESLQSSKLRYVLYAID